MNEKQVAIGESTCGARYAGLPQVGMGVSTLARTAQTHTSTVVRTCTHTHDLTISHASLKRKCPTCEGPLVDVTALSIVALERCDTARCAVEMIGSMSEQFGYYTAEPGNNAEAGEALTIADGKEVSCDASMCQSMHKPVTVKLCGSS